MEANIKIPILIEIEQKYVDFLQKQSSFQGVSEGRIVEELINSFLEQCNR